MAKLWIVYREGLRLLGTPVEDVSLNYSVPRLDLAPWRLFTQVPPESVTAEELAGYHGRKRVLVEVNDDDRNDLCGFVLGFFESPYSPEESLRRLKLAAQSS